MVRESTNPYPLFTKLSNGYEGISRNYLVTRFTGGFDLRDFGVPVLNDNTVAYVNSAFHSVTRVTCYI